jgi:hypothetical protein
LIAVYFGSPYALNRLPWHTNFKAFVVAYDNTEINNRAAAQLIFGGIPAKGVLPVATDLYECGYSERWNDAVRVEFVDYSPEQQFRMRGGKVYGNAIETADGAVLRYDALFRVEGELLSKSKMRRIAKLLGMGDSRFEKGYFTTTLDDMAKLVWTLMNNGVYGGERCIREGDCEALRA